MLRFLIILFTILIVGSSTVHAEEPGVEIIPTIKLPTLIDCGPPESAIALIEKFGEVPIAQANSYVQKPNGKIMPGVMAFYANTETYSYTVVVKLQLDVELWCIVNSGADFQPYIDGKPL